MKDVYTEINGVAKKVEQVVVDQTGRVIDPVRNSLFKRFPVSLTFLVTFGATATFYGTERLISEIDWLNERPFLILLSGVAALAFTGKLYQKLG